MGKKSKPIVVIDCETDPFSEELRKLDKSPEPFCWGIYDGENYQYFWETLDEFGEPDLDALNENLINYLCETYPDGANVYAHNGGKFDYFFILEQFTGKPRIINGRISEVNLHRNEKITFYDSYNIIPVPLAAINKDEFDYDKMHRRVRNIYKNEILRYLKNDCVYLFEAVERFISEFGKNLTISGASQKQLKQTDYKIPKTYHYHDETFRKFYFGGRVQTFEVGAIYGKFKFYDINSAYPYAMTKRHPYGNPVNKGSTLPENEDVFYFAKITAIAKGCLPFKQKVNGAEKLFFPDDDEAREYFANSWEIRAGLRTNSLQIIKVHDCFAYPKTKTKCMTEFVEKFFALRKEAKANGDKMMVLFYKLILNSCYGKFGQDGRRFEEIIIDDGETEFFRSFELASEAYPQLEDEDDDFYLKRINEKVFEYYCTTENGVNLYARPDPANDFYDVAVAASITGYVRAMLWETIYHSKRPLYCDTDSLLCEELGGEIGSELGQWDLEAETIENYIVARKMYACRTTDLSDDVSKQFKIASKGVRLDFYQIKYGVLTAKDFVYVSDAPTFSLKTGTRYTPRTVNFSNILSNCENNPPKISEN